MSETMIPLTKNSSFWFGLVQSLHEAAEHDLAWKIDDAYEKAQDEGSGPNHITLNFTHDEIISIFQLFMDRM